MKKSPTILFVAAVVISAGLAVWLRADLNAFDDPLALKRKAYDLYERGHYDQAAKMFLDYVAVRPADVQASYDYALLLIQLNRNADAATMLATVCQLEPGREVARFQLGTQFVLLQRDDEAAAVFAVLAKSSNPDMARAAAAAGARLAADRERVTRARAQQRVYDLAKELKHADVIAAVDELEREGDLPFALSMQRIYAYAGLQQYTQALRLADQLAVQHPKATDLMLLRAELCLQLGRHSEALGLLKQIARENPDSEVARVVEKRLVEVEALNLATNQIAAVAEGSSNASPGAGPVPPPLSDEAVVYNLAEKRQYREVVAAIDEMEKKRGMLAWNMKMQRLYAFQALGEVQRACREAESMAAEHPDSVELAVLRADLLFQARRWSEASVVLNDIRLRHPNTPVAKAAGRRLTDIPAVANLDKWNWGESYNSGDYHSRYDSLIGYGYLRTGTYVPHARWLQPYVSFNYVVDTKSGAGTRETIISDNSVGVYGGLRAQLFTREYLFAYIQGGWNKDLLDRRDDGDWRFDYMGGVYGYKSWGPGINWTQEPPVVSGGSEQASRALEPVWRGDWWVDAGADFSYYDRFTKWLGYGQVREGLRLAQFGNNVAMDAYVMQNLAWDVEGTYTDNLIELGPGWRMIYVPFLNGQVVLRTEWVRGFYLGRGEQGDTGNAYDDFRVGLSIGVSW